MLGPARELGPHAARFRGKTRTAHFARHRTGKEQSIRLVEDPAVGWPRRLFFARAVTPLLFHRRADRSCTSGISDRTAPGRADRGRWFVGAGPCCPRLNGALLAAMRRANGRNSSPRRLAELQREQKSAWDDLHARAS